MFFHRNLRIPRLMDNSGDKANKTAQITVLVSTYSANVGVISALRNSTTDRRAK